MQKGFRAVAFTRDRHPPNHCSFQSQGGLWPPHCVDGTVGFQFHPDVLVPPGAIVADKGTKEDEDNFDGFHATGLGDLFRQQGVRRVFVSGLATEYCVKSTVLGSLREGFETWVIVDAIAGVESRDGDCDRALVEMRSAGAELTESGQVTTLLVYQPHPSGLVVVDLQNDFCKGGALAVPNAERILSPIQTLLRYSPRAR